MDSSNISKKDNFKSKKRPKKPLFVYNEYENVLNLNVQLPHSFRLEKTLLSCIMVHCDTSFQTLEIILEHLPVDAFYFKNHQRLYEIFIEMYQQDLAIDFLTTTDYIQCYGLSYDIGGLTVLGELLKEIPNAMQFP